MTDELRQRPSLKDAYADRNGQGLGRDSAGPKDGGASDATAPENLNTLGDAAQAAPVPTGAAAEAIERATAPVGTDEGE